MHLPVFTKGGIFDPEISLVVGATPQQRQLVLRSWRQLARGIARVYPTCVGESADIVPVRLAYEEGPHVLGAMGVEAREQVLRDLDRRTSEAGAVFVIDTSAMALGEAARLALRCLGYRAIRARVWATYAEADEPAHWRFPDSSKLRAAALRL